MVEKGLLSCRNLPAIPKFSNRIWQGGEAGFGCFQAGLACAKGYKHVMVFSPGMNIFFDLDGTISDPELGITRCIQHALAALDRPVPATHELRFAIGPPLRGTFAQLLNSTDQTEIGRAVALYRERFSTIGLFENTLYDGVTAVLDELVTAGYCLTLVTAKPMPYATRIIEHFSLQSHFSRIYGSELNGRFDDKGELIEHVLRAESLSASRCVMVGDRIYDIHAAHRNGVKAIGALWGFGTREELGEADMLCERPISLPAVLPYFAQ